MTEIKHPLRESLIVTLAALLIYLLRLAYLDGGAIHDEAFSFLRVYTDGRPFWETIYNPAFNDWIMYQPRELSYFFDWLDAHVITISFRFGWVHFYSLSCLLAAVGTVFLQQYGARKCFPRVDERLVTIVSLIYILLPLTSISYYRSAKPLTALFLTGACFLSVELFRRLREDRNGGWLLFFLTFSLLLMTLADRQGAFFATVYAAFCGFLLLLGWKLPWLKNRKLLLKTAFASWSVVLFGMVYNLILSPSLVYRLNGYVPDFDYQYTNPGDVLRFADGIEFITNNLGLFFTGYSSRLAAGAGILCTVLLFLSQFRTFSWRDGRILGPFLFLYAGAAMLACANVMSAKCQAILIPESLGNGSYATPMLALVVCFLFYALHRCARNRKWKTAWSIILSLSLFSQLSLYVSFGDYPEAFEQHWHNAFGEETGMVKYLLKHPEEDYRKYTLSFRNILLIRQMRGLPAFEDENRAYYYLNLYRGVRI